MRTNPNFDVEKIKDKDLRERFRKPPPVDGYMRWNDLSDLSDEEE